MAEPEDRRVRRHRPADIRKEPALAPEEERPRVSHLRVVHDQLPSTVYPEHFRSYYSDPYHEVTLPRERMALTFRTKPPNPRVKFVPLYEILGLRIAKGLHTRQSQIRHWQDGSFVEQTVTLDRAA